MIHMNKNNITYLVGNETLQIKPMPVYSDLVCDFLNDLSALLRKDNRAKQFPDIMTFAFWCRKANILKLKEEYPCAQTRVGRGLVFHIAPSNVPINFAYTLVFGILSGNANVVRVSEKGFEQTEIVCGVLNRLLEQEKYRLLAGQIQIVSYGHDASVNQYYSGICNVRVIWGGDATIREIRKGQLLPRSTEITFADRYSFGIFDERAVSALPQEELTALAEKFYNDTYLMDQNACSSPHTIFWLNGDGAGRKRFWETLCRTAGKYDLSDKKVMDKYTMLCENAVYFDEVTSCESYGNLLYVAALGALPEKIEDIRGRFGLFYEKDIDAMQDICGLLSEKVQTCVVFGVEKKDVVQCLTDNYVQGVDRVVSVGDAMDIGVYWDGYDVIGSLSRGIEY